MRNIGFSAGAIASLALAAVLAGAFLTPAGDSSGRWVAERLGIRSVRAAGSPRFTADEALGYARAAAEQELLLAPEGDRSRTSGRPLAIGDFQVVSVIFLPAQTSVAAGTGSSFRSSKPVNLWAAVLSADSVEVPSFGTSNAVVRVEVLLEDGTGRIRSAGMSRVNLDAAPPTQN